MTVGITDEKETSMRSKIALLATVIAIVAATALFVGWPGKHSASPKTAVLAGLRHVIVVPDNSPARSPVVKARLCGPSFDCANGLDGVDVVVLERGAVPEQPVRAVVETDVNCTPDAYGISHCTNRLRLADGSRIEVRHDHNMRLYPCLRPGEVVAVEGERSV